MPMIQGVSQKKDNKWTSSQDPNMLNNVINMATEHGSQAQVFDSEKQVVRNLSFKQGGSLTESNGIVSWAEDDVLPEMEHITPLLEDAIPIIEEVGPLLLL